MSNEDEDEEDEDEDKDEKEETKEEEEEEELGGGHPRNALHASKGKERREQDERLAELGEVSAHGCRAHIACELRQLSSSATSCSLHRCTPHGLKGECIAYIASIPYTAAHAHYIYTPALS